MSADDSAAHQSAPAGDKAQAQAQPPVPASAPKAAATFSSFINKNTTGKKFAPKAARRRPGATSATAPSAPVAPAAPEPAVEPSVASQAESSPSQQALESSLVPQLPTPAATQESAAQKSLPSEPPQNEDSTDTTFLASSQPRSVQAALPTPASTGDEDRHEEDIQVQALSGTTRTTVESSQPQDDGSQLSSRHKRPRIESPRHKTTSLQPQSIELSVDAFTLPVQPEGTQIQADISAQAASLSSELGQSESAAENVNRDGAAQPQGGRKRKLSWVAVNHPQEDGGEGSSATIRRPARNRGRKKTVTETNVETLEVVDEEADDDQVATSTPKPASARARGKRKATAVTEESAQDAPAKKPRKPKDTPVITTEIGQEGSGEAEQEIDGSTRRVGHRKPRLPKRSRTATEGEGRKSETDTTTKRKGRPPREATPSDAEDQTIDPETTFMDSLASRNIRVGKLSNREREMRKINWEEVKERWREEDRRKIKSKEEQSQADQAIAEQAANQIQAPEFTTRMIEVNGVIQIVQESNVMDREADANREIAEYEVIETQDLTTRITSRSFMKNNKRFPNDFLLPGQGMRWNAEMTDLFYQGLKSFGTDFQMISQMFPGCGRRSIKTKFTREERENPLRVKMALQGRSEIASHWNVFLEAAQLQDDSFVNADRVKQQMEEHAAEMRIKIAQAKAEAEERNRQKKLAGEMDDDNQDDSKENGKGKKKKRDKGKQVSFNDEPGVEVIVGDADEWVEQHQ